LLDAPSAGSEHFAWNHETFELGLSWTVSEVCFCPYGWPLICRGEYTLLFRRTERGTEGRPLIEILPDVCQKSSFSIWPQGRLCAYSLLGSHVPKSESAWGENVIPRGKLMWKNLL
jgi:hypothetical protein